MRLPCWLMMSAGVLTEPANNCMSFHSALIFERVDSSGRGQWFSEAFTSSSFLH